MQHTFKMTDYSIKFYMPNSDEEYTINLSQIKIKTLITLIQSYIAMFRRVDTDHQTSD